MSDKCNHQLEQFSLEEVLVETLVKRTVIMTTKQLGETPSHTACADIVRETLVKGCPEVHLGAFEHSLRLL